MRRLVVRALSVIAPLGGVLGLTLLAHAAEPPAKPSGDAPRSVAPKKPAVSSAQSAGAAKPAGAPKALGSGKPEPTAKPDASAQKSDPRRSPAPDGGKGAPGSDKTGSSAELKRVVHMPGPESLDSPAAPAPAKPGAPNGKAHKPTPPKAPPKAQPKTAIQKGRAPRQPSATLPAGATKSEPNEAVRRQIAAVPGADATRTVKLDPELKALSEAEKVLFPRPLEGLTSGWSWDLPRPVGGGPTVSTSGVPPSRTRAALGETEPSREDAEWLKSLAPPNVPVRLDARVVKYLKFYRDSARGKSIVRAWAQKSGKFVPAMQAQFAKAGLPTDLVWLSLIESGHNATIQSPAGAAGLWQFVPETARLYGLTVDRWVDERLDPKRSTEAAILYLSDLYQRFGTWELAMAAYNMGFGGLGKAIRKYNTNDFWELGRHEAGVPWETALYVPKILATAIVMNNRKAFGIADVTPVDAMAFDTVMVQPGTSLSRVAAAAQVALPKIEELNPHLLESRTPPAAPASAAAAGKSSAFAVRVPTGKGTKVVERLQTLETAGEVEAEAATYVVRFGDTCKAIAAELGVNPERLIKLNGLGENELLEGGTVLLVPKRIAGGTRRESEESVVVVSSSEFSYPDRRRVFYRTRWGDSLASVAEAFGVTPEELLGWNALDRSARLQSGMALQLFVPRTNSLARVRHVEDQDVRVLVVGSDEFFDYFEKQNGKKRIRVVAKEGDTLKSIGQKYGMTVGSMERINRRANSEALMPGETVIAYAPLGAAAGRVAEGPMVVPLAPLRAGELGPTDTDVEAEPAAWRGAAGEVLTGGGSD